MQSMNLANDSQQPGRGIPDKEQCLGLIESYGMLDNIREHSFVVAAVAKTLVSNLCSPKDNAISPPNLDLVLAGALLHDIAKTQCLDGSCKHAEEGQQICIDHGFPEVGAIVGQHVILASFTPEQYRNGCFGAREIVYYSDKRVKHTDIVSLSDRLDYIIDRYGDGTNRIETRIRANFQHCLELEKHLFTYLPFVPDELAHFVKEHQISHTDPQYQQG